MSLNKSKQWLEKLYSLQMPGRIKIMNVCGGHERTLSRHGIRSLIPENIELIPGPGCPVCVCPEQDIYLAIQLALNEDVILTSFGDMLRVPVNVARNAVRTLDQARTNGADVRPIASPLDAVRIALENSDKKVVFFVTGFETTTAPVAAMIAEGIPDNLFVLLSGRLTWPAVSMLLDSGQPGFDALIAPGHVATIMGSEEWQFVADKYAIPVAIAGFEPENMLAALYSVLRQIREGRVFLDNCYGQVVHKGGNTLARRFLANTLDIVDSDWRGIGVIRKSGFELCAEYAAHDVRRQFPNYRDDTRRRLGEMPSGCDCASVVLGRIYPDQCRLYGVACRPEAPVGPCMVSDEGACHIWWNNRRRTSVVPEPAATIVDIAAELIG